LDCRQHGRVAHFKQPHMQQHCSLCWAWTPAIAVPVLLAMCCLPLLLLPQAAVLQKGEQHALLVRRSEPSSWRPAVS
jgi:hypothetical protein